MKLNIDDIEPKKLCSKWPNCNHDLLSTFENKKCKCGNLMTRSFPDKSRKVYKGFVKDEVTFTVMNDLFVCHFKHNVYMPWFLEEKQGK